VRLLYYSVQIHVTYAQVFLESPNHPLPIDSTPNHCRYERDKMFRRHLAAAILFQVLLLCTCSSTPLYECEENVWNFLLASSGKRRSFAPRGENGTLSVNAIAYLNKVSIFDQATPAMEVSGTLLLSWEDPRLAWNSSELGGCKEIQVASSEIWTPSYVKAQNAKDANGKELATITSAKGAVSLTIPVSKAKAYCRRSDRNSSFERLCTADFTEQPNSIGGIKYILTAEVENQAVLAVPGYSLSADFLSSFLQIYLHKLDSPNKCSICGGIRGAKLRNETVPTSQTVGTGDWIMAFPDSEGFNCKQLEEYINNQEVGFVCRFSRTMFMQACCEGLPSKSSCEENVRNNVLDGLHNTVVPPDDPKGGEVLDVSVLLDVTHILGIDIQSNTLEMLVSLKLIWTDTRLVWDPLVGGCNSVSYRASIDKEQTEIWVPNVDLLNQVEGVQNLPIAAASVFWDGYVLWKRTGIIRVACDLKGVQNFPFDNPSCSVDFGGARDPLIQRLNYVYIKPFANDSKVEFSKRLGEKAADFQEYQVETNDTIITIEDEILSGYVHKFIRFQFYFKRSQTYYFYLFVMLYLLFTYMSFGMFLLKAEEVGERLGFGTAILFVIVAQDITMAAYTPVSQNLLWIYQFSIGSKLFVILGIFESILYLHLFYHDLEEIDAETNTGGENEESAGAMLHNNEYRQHKSMVASSIEDDELPQGRESEDGVGCVNDEEKGKDSMAEDYHSQRKRNLNMKSVLSDMYRPLEVPKKIRQRKSMATSSIGDDELPQGRYGVGCVNYEEKGRDSIAENYHSKRKSNPKKKSFLSYIKEKILAYRPIPGETEFRRRVRLLRLMDRSFFLVILFAYTLFCMIMFGMIL